MIRSGKEQNLRLIENSLNWVDYEGHFIDKKICMALNFGYSEKLPFPQIQMNLDWDWEVFLGTKGMEAPNGCFFVIIGGKYKTQLERLLIIVDKISIQMRQTPFSIFVITDNGSEIRSFNTKVKALPPLVNFNGIYVVLELPNALINSLI